MILAAAIRCFAEEGFQAVSTSRIAAAAGATEGLVRYYHGNREALLAKCDTQVLTELRDHYEKVGRRIAGTPGQKIVDRLIELNADLFGEKPYLLRYLAALFGSSTLRGDTAFAEYFAIMRSHVEAVDAAAPFSTEIDVQWLTFQITLIQLGPAFLKGPIESVLGADIYGPEAASARQRQIGIMLKRGVFADGRGDGAGGRTRR